MKFFSPFTILFVLVILQESLISSNADQKFIQDTCKNTPSYELCMSILLADPKSKEADLTGLSLIGVAAINKKGVEIIQKVEYFIKKNTSPQMRRPLDECKVEYSTVVKYNVPEANQALRGGQVKFAEDALVDSAVESDACEASFVQHGVMSPMTDMNTSMNILANVVRAIVRMLL